MFNIGKLLLTGNDYKGNKQITGQQLNSQVVQMVLHLFDWFQLVIPDLFSNFFSLLRPTLLRPIFSRALTRDSQDLL